MTTSSITVTHEAAAELPTDGENWGRRHTAGVSAILTAIAGVGIVLPWAAGGSGGYAHARLAAWLLTLALLLALSLVVGSGLTGLARGAFVDERNKLSPSRVQLFLWTALVLSAYLSAALANAGLGADEPLAIRVPEPLWLAMGVSTSSLVASPLVLHRAKGKQVAVNEAPADSRWTDLVRGEEHGFAGVVDLGKLQLLLVTIVLVVAYGAVVGRAFLDDHQVVTSLPRIDDAFVIMLGISHAGYLAKKTVPRPHHA